MSSVRIGVVGDLHTHWDEVDIAHFDRSEYDLLIFTGDLGGGSRDSSLRVARSLSRLSKPALVMPGNNDVGDIAEFAAELAHRDAIRQFSAIRQGRAASAPGDRQPLIRLCGYSSHLLGSGDTAFTLIAGRPHSMGGPELAFVEHMEAEWGIDSLAASARRLRQLVDDAQTRDLVFLGHNGPAGLGHDATDIWGCDFREGGGDWGDPDLAVAIDHALAQGRRVLAVIGGHMHLRTKGGSERPWQVERLGALYVNAARVPRIRARDGDVYRHHVALTVTVDSVEVAEILVPQYGSQSIVSRRAAIRRADTP
jgi:uncharacterized protein (TIGR04168 family)